MLIFFSIFTSHVSKLKQKWNNFFISYIYFTCRQPLMCPCFITMTKWLTAEYYYYYYYSFSHHHYMYDHCQCKYSYILISFKGYHSAGTNEFPKIFPNHCSPPYPCCDYVCHAYITSVQSVVPVHNKRKRIFDKNVHKDFINGESLKQPEINFLLPNHQRQSTEDCVLPAHSQWPVHRIDQTKLQVIEV